MDAVAEGIVAGALHVVQNDLDSMSDADFDSWLAHMHEALQGFSCTMLRPKPRPITCGNADKWIFEEFFKPVCIWFMRSGKLNRDVRKIIFQMLVPYWKEYHYKRLYAAHRYELSMACGREINGLSDATVARILTRTGHGNISNDLVEHVCRLTDDYTEAGYQSLRKYPTWVDVPGAVLPSIQVKYRREPLPLPGPHFVSLFRK
jgi:hypothetical protein